MIPRISRLIIFLIALGAILYIVLLNREPITVHFSGATTLTAMGGVVLIVTFVLGIIAASFVGVFLGIRSYVREQRLRAREKHRKAFAEGLQVARGYAASQEWNKSRAEYEYLIKRHPHDVISRVELSRVVEGQGELREALRLVDAARVEAPADVEVLLRAAELNIKLKNKTAAIDNLALVLASQPSKYAARLARDLSEELERFDDALEYQERLDSLGYAGDESEAYRTGIRFKNLLKESTDPAHLREGVQSFARREGYSPALEKLAELCLESGDKLGAAQHLAKVARQDGSVQALKQATELWIELNQPDQALSTIRATGKEAQGAARLAVELELIRACINLRMLDEAKGALAKLPTLMTELGEPLTPERTQQIQALQAFAAARLGDLNRTDATLAALTRGAPDVDWSSGERSAPIKSSEAPAPRLSTP